jgi:hypothetical protein
MNSRIERFDSFAAADEAEAAYYASLTPEQRLEVLFELIASFQESQGEDSRGFERVYRLDELSRS